MPARRPHADVFRPLRLLSPRCRVRTSSGACYSTCRICHVTECEKPSSRRWRAVGLDPDTRFSLSARFSAAAPAYRGWLLSVLSTHLRRARRADHALDIADSSRKMVDRLCALQKRHDRTYLFISHDLPSAAMPFSLMVMKRTGGSRRGRGPHIQSARRPPTPRLFAASLNLELA